ncbi:MAG: TonB-dependent receptor [Mariprofundales bacterium]
MNPFIPDGSTITIIKKCLAFSLSSLSLILLLAVTQANAGGIITEEIPKQAELTPIIVTATRISSPLANNTSDVTIIDSETLQNMQAVTVADALRAVVGVDVIASGGAGALSSVFLRGANSGHSLVLIDGVRVGSATTGSFDWAHLATIDVERIEIVRGAQSSLYGADAIGGVIQIFTKKGGNADGKTHASAQLEAGTYASKSANVHLRAGSADSVNYNISASSMRTTGISAAANGTEPDSYRNTTLSGNIGIPIGAGNVALLARHARGVTSIDGFSPPTFQFGDVLGDTNSTTQRVFSAKIDYPIFDLMNTTLQLSKSSDELRIAGSFNGDFRTDMNLFTWQNNIDLDNISLLFGLDYHSDKARSASLNHRINQQAGFTAIAWHSDLLDINAAMRHDKNSVTTNKTTYKLGLGLRPLDDMIITANYGTGFKMPSINDLYFPADMFSSGNLNLLPETSRSWDIGLEYNSGWNENDVQLKAVYFNQDLQQLIQWQPINPLSFVWMPQNIANANTRGWELSTKLDAGHGYAQITWTYLLAHDLANNMRLPRRAKERGSILLGAWLGDVLLEVQTDIVGSRFSDAANTKAMRGYHKTALRLNYTMNEHFTWHARVENIENRNYEEVSGYGTLGRTINIGIGLQ